MHAQCRDKGADGLSPSGRTRVFPCPYGHSPKDTCSICAAKCCMGLLYSWDPGKAPKQRPVVLTKPHVNTGSRSCPNSLQFYKELAKLALLPSPYHPTHSPEKEVSLRKERRSHPDSEVQASGHMLPQEQACSPRNPQPTPFGGLQEQQSREGGNKPACFLSHGTL